MKTNQTLIKDEELLNPIVELKVSELLKQKENNILDHAGLEIRKLVIQYVKDNNVFENIFNKDLNTSNSNSMISLTINRLITSRIEMFINNMSSSQLYSYCKNAVEQYVLQNSRITNDLHPLLVEIIKEDVNFRTVLKGQVELALKSKIEKFLNKSSYNITNELFNKFIKQQEDKS